MAVIALGTIGTLTFDLVTPFLFSPWVLYSILPFFAPQLIATRAIFGLGAVWTTLIIAGGVYTQTHESLLLGWLNRALGISALWYFLVLLHQARAAAIVRDQEEERFRTVLHSALDAVISIQDTNLVTAWNPQAEAMFGYSEQEALGKPLSGLIIPERYQEAHAKGMAHYRATGEGPILNRRIEIPARHRNGTEFPVELTVTPFRCGTTVSFTAFARDITERKRTEQSQVDARQTAETANRAKSDFLANVSHELRTPLNVVLGVTDLLLESPLQSEQRRHVEMTRRAGRTLLSLVNELLDLGKIESGTLQLIEEPFDLDELANRVIALLGEEAGRKGLLLRYRMAEETPTRLVGDPGRLQQILINLLGNAIKFTPQGEVSLSIACTDHTPQHATLRFVVTDTGVGIPADKLGLIFDRFTQADTSSSRHHSGVGLGLAICRQLATLMRGTLTVDSTIGKGSTFTLQVRLERHHVAGSTGEGDPTVTVAGTANQTACPQRVLHVLLAEDFPEGQELIAAYLKGTPHRLDIVEDGACAVARAQNHRYDLILMDLQMPEMDGYQATAAIRAWETKHARRAVPIVALTANALKRDGSRALEIGFTAFVTKPVSKTTLLDVLDRYALPDSDTEQQAATVSPNSGPQSAPFAAALDPLRVKFLRNRRQELVALHTALDAQDFDTLQRIGHQVKGLAGSFGYEEIGERGASLEQAARAKNRAEIARCMTELDAAIARAEGERRHAA